MLMPGGTDTDAALAANVIVRASFDSVIPGNFERNEAIFRAITLFYFGITIKFGMAIEQYKLREIKRRALSVNHVHWNYFAKKKQLKDFNS